MNCDEPGRGSARPRLAGADLLDGLGDATGPGLGLLGLFDAANVFLAGRVGERCELFGGLARLQRGGEVVGNVDDASPLVGLDHDAVLRTRLDAGLGALRLREADEVLA